jgi:hypothetical protein
VNDETEQWSIEQRTWMRGNLDRAAKLFGLVVTGEPRWGWWLRSASAPAKGLDGRCWLRVGAEHERWVTDPKVSAFWTGIPDSVAITGVSKPAVLHSAEWSEPDRQQRVRADVMTLLPGRPCSQTDVLRFAPDLPDIWWTNLRRSLDALRSHPTTRFRDRGGTGDRVRAVLGVDLRIDQFETVHGDLHWSNVLGPQLGLLDWEMWGCGPAGMDAASLYLHALLVPDVARRVHDAFADVLDSAAGRAAQLHVAAAVLDRAKRESEYADLADVLRGHVRPMVLATMPN